MEFIELTVSYVVDPQPRSGCRVRELISIPHVHSLRLPDTVSIT
jgi:hypothetical protein